MRRLILGLAVVSAAGCNCDKVKPVKPSIDVQPASLVFGSVKNGGSKSLSLTLTAKTGLNVEVTKLDLQGSTDGYTVALDPITVSASAPTDLPVTFHPTSFEEYDATLTLTTNDEEHPTIHIPFIGQGAKPKMVVSTDCAASRGCMGTVTPTSMDYGMAPLGGTPNVDPSKLPTVI